MPNDPAASETTAPHWKRSGHLWRFAWVASRASDGFWLVDGVVRHFRLWAAPVPGEGWAVYLIAMAWTFGLGVANGRR